MISTGSDRFVEALAQLNRYAESKPGARQAKPPLSIAMTRQAGSRGAEIARAVGARLDWPVYDHELLRRIAEEKGVQARLLEMLDERHMGWLEEMIASAAIGQPSHETTYLRSLLKLFATLGEVGHCVIVGRGAAHVLVPDTTLRVRIIAPRADRAATVARSQHLSPAEAEKWVDRTDSERKRFVQHYFNRNTEDPLGYDLILNSSRLGIEGCTSIIADAAHTMESVGQVS
jgi:cytidylate kinase